MEISTRPRAYIYTHNYRTLRFFCHILMSHLDTIPSPDNKINNTIAKETCKVASTYNTPDLAEGRLIINQAH